MGEVLIKADNVSKKFAKDFKRSLYYGVKDVFSRVSGAEKAKELRKSEFWAVRDVSFEVRRGECVGLIGRNGAGKSTLLKMLNGLINPDKGNITIRGKVVALIELGAGFNPILTGRENIYNNASVLGFSKEEVDKLFEEIVEFSELKEFIDTPVQNYSSGMKVRLGFSVAVHLKPDVLILDEVLAVGDAGFRMKSLNKMYELINTCAVIFVNHDATQIARSCNKILYMKNGEIAYWGNNVTKGIELYQTQLEGEQKFIAYNKEAKIDGVSLYSDENRALSKEDDNITKINYGDDLIIEIEYSIEESVSEHVVILSFNNKNLVTVASFISKSLINNSSIKKKCKIIIPHILFTNGEYSVNIFIRQGVESKKNKIYADYRNWAKFNVRNTQTYISVPFLLAGQTEEVY